MNTQDLIDLLASLAKEAQKAAAATDDTREQLARKGGEEWLEMESAYVARWKLARAQTALQKLADRSVELARLLEEVGHEET